MLATSKAKYPESPSNILLTRSKMECLGWAIPKIFLVVYRWPASSCQCSLWTPSTPKFETICVPMKLEPKNELTPTLSLVLRLGIFGLYSNSGYQVPSLVPLSGLLRIRLLFIMLLFFCLKASHTIFKGHHLFGKLCSANKGKIYVLNDGDYVQPCHKKLGFALIY